MSPYVPRREGGYLGYMPPCVPRRERGTTRRVLPATMGEREAQRGAYYPPTMVRKVQRDAYYPPTMVEEGTTRRVLPAHHGRETIMRRVLPAHHVRVRAMRRIVPPWVCTRRYHGGHSTSLVCTRATLVGVHLPVYVSPFHPGVHHCPSPRSWSYSAVSTPLAVTG